MEGGKLFLIIKSPLVKFINKHPSFFIKSKFFYNQIWEFSFYVLSFFERIKFRKKIDRLDFSHSEGKKFLNHEEADRLSDELRKLVRQLAGISIIKESDDSIEDLEKEISVLNDQAHLLVDHFNSLRSKRVLYSGQCYYNSYYLSRSLRNKSWRADVLDWDPNQASKKYYHGHDFEFTYKDNYDVKRDINFYIDAIYRYDVFHFSNPHGISFGVSSNWFGEKFGENFEIYLLKKLGKKIVYSNNGCQDGVRQSSFAKWGPYSPCQECSWRDNPQVCSDTRNSRWGMFRNSVADYQCLLGGNRVDFNVSPNIHEVPEFYCLKPEIWDPAMPVPEEYKLPERRPGEIRVYHAVGNFDTRTNKDGVNIKSTHIYLPLIDKLRGKGLDIELVSPNGVPNLDVRYLQLQADIFLEMLTFGWFGANAREAMMLGKPVICFIRPEWLATLRKELPEYADELPVVSALPETVEEILENLIRNEDLRAEIGAKSRAFALKWHSDKAGGERFDRIYSELLLEEFHSNS